MATAKIIKPLSVYINAKKFAEISGGDYTIDSGDEAQIADGGWQGSSDGAITCKFDFSTIIPVSGQSVDPVAIMLAKQYVQVSIPIGTKIHEVTCRFSQAGHSWDHAKGTATGKYSLMGGKPEATGL